MLRTTLKSFAARKLRLLLTATAIVLGVAFATGALVLTDTSTRLFDEQFAEATAGVDVVVRDAAAFGSAMGVEVERDPVPTETLDTIRATEGVAGAEGSARGSALLVVDGEAAVPGGPSMGLSWGDAPFSPYRLADGRPPRTDGEVVVDVATAEAYGVEVGDTVGVTVADGARTAEVVGTARFGDAAGVPNATVALFAPATAQELFGLGTGWSEVQVVADRIAADELADRLTAALADGWEVSTSKDTAAASAAAARDQLVYLEVMLGVLAVTALVVGGFMIANTFGIVVAQRTRELATLRALGASSRQVTASVLGEALVVGMVASSAGVALGVAAAVGLRRLAGVFGVVIPDGPLAVEPRTLVVGVAVGLAVTLVASLAPARRAAGVAPVAAMRDSAPAARAVSRVRLVAGALLVGSGAAGLVGGATTGSMPAAGAGGAAVLVGTVVLAPAFAGRLGDRLGGAVRGGLVPRLARTNLRRAERRTAATAIALAVGLAVVTFMTVVATSVKEAMTGGVDDVVTAELVVQSGRGEMLGGLSPEVLRHAAEVPGVEVGSPIRFGHWLDGERTAALTAVDPATLPQVADVDFVEGSMADLSSGGIVLAEDAAAEHGVGVGDELPMTLARTGEQSLEVVGVFAAEDAWALSTGYVVALGTYAEHFAEDVDATVFVGLADGADPAAVQAEVEAALADFPTAEVHDQASAAKARTRMLDSMLGLVTVLLLLAVVIALLGITNALALSIVERTREVGLLRAVGMSRRQVGWMVRLEAALTAAVGALTGLALGVVVAVAVVQALGGAADVPFTVPVVQLAAYVAVATAGGVLAGLLPGRRAARMDVLEAVATA
jgi:putative ABC transport system permease protein